MASMSNNAAADDGWMWWMYSDDGEVKVRGSLGELVRQPVQALVQTVARGGCGSLDVPPLVPPQLC